MGGLPGLHLLHQHAPRRREKVAAVARDLISSDKTIRALQPGAGRLSDGAGLYLKPFVNGNAHGWRFDYSFAGLRKTLSLGTYPEIGLSKAREVAARYRTLVAEGTNPSDLRKENRAETVERNEAETRMAAGLAQLGSFEEVARRWYEVRKSGWYHTYAPKILGRLENHVFPHIGQMRVESIDAPYILELCRRVETDGHIETAHRVLKICSQVFRFAIAERQIRLDPCADLRDALQQPDSRNFAAITDTRELPGLLRDLDDYGGSFVVQCALRLAPMLMLRPGEMRLGNWEEIDLDNGMWLVPSARMKRRKKEKLNGAPHLVPLSRQAVQILEQLFEVTGRTGRVFAGSGRALYMSNNTINKALRSMGYSTQDDVTGHGFRATARTLLVELLQFPESVAEAQLSHAVKDATGTAYNRAQFLKARFDMMQAWASYLDDLKAGSSVVVHPVLPEFTPVTRRLLDKPEVACPDGGPSARRGPAAAQSHWGAASLTPRASPNP